MFSYVAGPMLTLALSHPSCFVALECCCTLVGIIADQVIETRKFALTPGLTPKELVQEAEMLKRVDHEYIIKLEDIFQVGCRSCARTTRYCRAGR